MIIESDSLLQVNTAGRLRKLISTARNASLTTRKLLTGTVSDTPADTICRLEDEACTVPVRGASPCYNGELKNITVYFSYNVLAHFVFLHPGDDSLSPLFQF
jgi:hypothetical protein